MQETIERFLLEHLKDPRLHAGRWAGVRDDARQVMLHWQIGNTLEVFFEILDKLAKDAHWRQRQAFWRPYHGKRLIDEAWVILAREASNYASRAFPDGLGFGRFSARDQVQENHGVLLMRIDSLIIAEWSHDGACNIWRKGDPRAPRFYQTARYDKDQLRTNRRNEDSRSEPPWKVYHHPGGAWRDKVAEMIYRETRIRRPWS